MPGTRHYALAASGVALMVLSLAACDSAPSAPDPEMRPDVAIASLNVGTGIPMNAVVSFGRDDVGSPFPPPSGHDASGHARDKQFPRTVVIRAGGSVTFQLGIFHTVAVYDRGVLPGDIDASLLVDLTAPPPAPPGTVIIPGFLIDDPTNRLAVGPFSFVPLTWDSPPGTFDLPGRYLVICRVVPHFVDSNMYAWVLVK